MGLIGDATERKAGEISLSMLNVCSHNANYNLVGIVSVCFHSVMTGSIYVGHLDHIKTICLLYWHCKN